MTDVRPRKVEAVSSEQLDASARRIRLSVGDVNSECGKRPATTATEAGALRPGGRTAAKIRSVPIDSSLIMVSPLYSLTPDARALLALEPEELAGTLVEIVPRISQQAGFLQASFAQLTPRHDQEYPRAQRPRSKWLSPRRCRELETQKTIVRNPA
jgi:hypothetical protein